jgi:hypothetical protein
MRLANETIITAFLASESLKPGTPIFLDNDGDIAFKEDGDVEFTPDGFSMLCTAEPNKFPLRNVTVIEKDGVYSIAGYGNTFESRLDALLFAVNHLGIYIDDLDDFARHITHNIKHSSFVA